MEDRDLVKSFLSVVDETVVASIEQSQERLKGCGKLIKQYRDQCKAWHAQNVGTARNITERVNELCIAKAIVEAPTVADAEYEAPLAGTGKTIDFLVRPKDNPDQRIFYDVKTVHPEPHDAWEQYQRFTTKGWWAPKTELTLERDWMGGEIAHDKFASRVRFIEHTFDLEAKIAAITERDGTFFRMVFCGNGFQWHPDELEDFAEGYFTGRSRWDHFASMQQHWLAERGFGFQRTIAGFCCLIRQVRSLEFEYRSDMRVPKQFR